MLIDAGSMDPRQLAAWSFQYPQDRKGRKMRVRTLLALATTLSWSTALARDLIVEPCHSVRLQYDTDIREVHIGNETLVDAVVPVQSKRLLIFTAKPRTTTQTAERGNQTITTTSTECLNATGSTTLIVLDENGNEIFPSIPPITSNEVRVQWPRVPGEEAKIHATKDSVYDYFTYSCTPLRCIEVPPRRGPE
jgi:hypothetical protein